MEEAGRERRSLFSIIATMLKKDEDDVILDLIEETGEEKMNRIAESLGISNITLYMALGRNGIVRVVRYDENGKAPVNTFRKLSDIFPDENANEGES